MLTPQPLHKNEACWPRHRSSTFQPQRDMDNIIQFLEGNLGICQVDIFKRGELKSENCLKIKPMYVHETEKNRFMKTTKDIVSKCQDLMREYDSFCQKGERVQIVNAAAGIVQALFLCNICVFF